MRKTHRGKLGEKWARKFSLSPNLIFFLRIIERTLSSRDPSVLTLVSNINNQNRLLTSEFDVKSVISENWKDNL